MPKWLVLFGYQVYVWSNEGVPLEPVHVHIAKRINPHGFKVWIRKDGKCEVARGQDKRRIPACTLAKILDALNIYSDDLVEKWKERFHEASFIDEQRKKQK